MTGMAEDKDIQRQIVLGELIPNEGDSVLIVNCGDRYEMQSYNWCRQLQDVPEALLTEEDLRRLRAGKIVWN